MSITSNGEHTNKIIIAFYPFIRDNIFTFLHIFIILVNEIEKSLKFCFIYGGKMIIIIAFNVRLCEKGIIPSN